MDRAQIAREGLDLLSEVGLDGLTVRRLATRLNVKSPALYWHFRSKQELLDEMAQALQANQDLGPPHPDETWRAWLARRARERRQVLLSRRDGARLMSGTRPGDTALRSFEEELQALVGFGFTPLGAVRAITSLGHFVSGFVLEEQAELERRPDPSGSHVDDLPPEEREGLLQAFPVLAAAVHAGGSPGGGDDAFEAGLTMMLDGITVRLSPDADPPTPR
ncbi:TetR/AcrR family transcriptional regulator C-terminal domain-containing protein [Spiractinospora alimapuensis]|uniref:TetR/AcrR family transcriptional regulator C-terminal domain-containing protein n=1 Tax=Spiractinospora alimapuensis TaxID=2820884 RepID=UPI001F1F4DDE|nr:TetR/AcrR family transcriptional regulator C-terminal domain-containing protein [Spiractinospora alimapuensis]QVQ50023.1 TetR/AcrR family transcriptional regulator C-terminal domain-containing protein [Spiractinospora alimapuensis]